jgi:hypothetical protein
MYSTSLLLIVSLDQVLRFESRLRSLTRDPELMDARACFDKVCPDAAALRNLVAHLDQYAIGECHRQTGKRNPPLAEDANLEPLISWTDDGSTTVNLAGHELDIRAAAGAALKLADIVERVRARWNDTLKTPRTKRSVNFAASRRRGRKEFANRVGAYLLRCHDVGVNVE